MKRRLLTRRPVAKKTPSSALAVTAGAGRPDGDGETTARGEALNPGEVAKAMRARFVQAETRLFQKLDAIDAEYLLQSLIAQATCRNSMGEPEPEIGTLPSLIEFAAFMLYPRFGRCANREPADIQSCLDVLTSHHREGMMVEGFLGVSDGDPELASLQVWLRLFELGVRCEAHACHTRELIIGIHGEFDGWFRHHLKITPERSLAVLDAFEKALKANYATVRRDMSGFYDNYHKFIELGRAEPAAAFELMKSEETNRKNTAALAALNDLPTRIPVSLDQVYAQDSLTTPDEWEALRDLVGMTVDRRREMSGWREVKRTPLFFFPDGRSLTAEISTIYEALFRSFEAKIKADTKKCNDYTEHMSHWMEARVADLLKRVFPPNCVYTNLTYPDPEKNGEQAEAEMDLAVQWGPYILLIEVKGKQFRDSSRWGDPARLRSDLIGSVEDAFAQTQRAARYIAETAEPRFGEKGSGRELHIKKGCLTTIFPVSVTLRDFRGLLTHLARFKTIGLFKESAYPWAVSLNDLNVITTFLTSPDAFIHYIKRRVEMQRADCIIAGDEIDLFCTYLSNRLDPEAVWARRGPNGESLSLLIIAPCDEAIQRWYRVEQGAEKGPKPVIGMKLPRCLEIALAALSARDDYEARCIAVRLLDLPGHVLSRVDGMVAGYLSGLTRLPLARITVHHAGVPITILLGERFPVAKVPESLEQRLHIEGYRCKSTTSVGLFFDVVGTAVAFHAGMILDKPWVRDEVMEKFIEDEPVILIHGQPLPDTYAPCFCGSGKTFKFCCKPKIKREA